MPTNRNLEGILRGRLSPEELMAIGDLAEAGDAVGRAMTSGQIARRLNRHPATVSYAMHRLGARTLVRREFTYWRNGSLVKSFSAEEDARLQQLRTDGMGPIDIAERLTAEFGHRRSQHTVRVRLVLLANAADADDQPGDLAA